MSNSILTLPNKQVLKSEASKELVRRELARRHITPFAKYTVPGFISTAFNRYLFQCLEKAANREPGWNRIIFHGPPQHGKTYGISEIFPAWYRGKYPDHPIIATGYGDELAITSSRHVRNIARSDEYRRVYPKVSVAPFSGEKKSGAGSWELEAPNLGVYNAAGVFGSIVGKAAKLLIIDDPIKNLQEAQSLVYQQRLIDAWKTVLSSRVHEDGIIIVMHQRWGENDFANWLLDKSGMGFKYIRIPALCDEPETDPLKRKLGECLWEGQFSASNLIEKKIMMGDYLFEALYQGNPRPREGLLFKRKGFKFIAKKDLPKGLRWVRFWDLATTTKKSSDFTVGLKAAIDGYGNVYLSERIRGLWEWYEVRERIRDVALQEPDVLLGVEAQGTQVGMVQELWRDPDLMHLGIIGVPVAVDKRVRAIPMQTRCAMGKVYLVEDEWNEEFIEEHLAFDKGEHDDQVDAGSGCMQLLPMVNAGSVISFAELLAETDAQLKEKKESGEETEAVDLAPKLHVTQAVNLNEL